MIVLGDFPMSVRVTVTSIFVALAVGSETVTAQSSRDSASSVLIGRISDSVGVAISAAQISVLPGNHRWTVTSDSGMFRFDGLAAGANLFAVRRFGFEPMTFTAVLKPAKMHRVKVVMSESSQRLPAVTVTDSAPAARWLDAFNARRAKRVGTFITRAEFQRWEPKTSMDILRSVPGVEIARIRGVNRVIFTRTASHRGAATMYVHGSPFGGQIDDFPVEDIEAIEIYKGVSEIPAEFDRIGRDVCAVINIWTRDPGKPPM